MLRLAPLLCLILLVARTVGAATLADLALHAPDAKLLWSWNNEIYLATLGDWQPKVIAEGHRARWSPSGDRILVANGDRLDVISSDLTGDQQELISGIAKGWFDAGFAWTRDGQAATVIMADKRTIKKVTVPSGKATVLYEDAEQTLGETAELRAGGRYLLMFRKKPNHIRVWDLQTKEAIDTSNLGANCTPAWSPDGSYFTNTLSAKERPIVAATFDPGASSIPEAEFLVGLGEITASQGICHYSRVSNDGKWIVFSGKQSWESSYESYIWRVGSPQAEVVKFTKGGGEAPDLFVPGVVAPPPPPPEGDAGTPSVSSPDAGPAPAPPRDAGHDATFDDDGAESRPLAANPTLAGGCQLWSPATPPPWLAGGLWLLVLLALKRRG